MVILRVKLEEMADCAYEEVDEADVQSPWGLGVGVARSLWGSAPLIACGRERTLKCYRSFFRGSKGRGASAGRLC